jgi:DNA polymerase I-like protein with 3'-5' exonuclease and polymerase domains
MSLIFDLEADGLLKEATKVHCIALCDSETGNVWSYGPNEIEKGLAELYEADTIVAHNGTNYDLPLLRKLYGWSRRPGTRLIDTLVVARLLHPNIKEDDYKRVDWDKKLVGSHSLRAWGLRLGEPKDDYEGPWGVWTQEMQDYCEQDVRTTYRLLTHLRPWEYPVIPLDLEHRVAEVVHLMHEEGWTFDIQRAQKLYTALVDRKDQLEKALVEKFGQWEEVDKVLIPKRDNKKLGYTAGVPVKKMKTVVFNPGSRVHIEKKLKEAGWEPTEFTESGRAKLDESVLERIEQPEAKLLVDYLVCQKRLGMLGDGNGSWLRLVEADGRIHGTINPNHCVTSRASHRSPNISQVPANRAIYGKDCRSLFCVPEGWKLVGADMAGLELRTFAHYLSIFDKGEYAKVVTEGDIHTYNQEAAGLPDRNTAKTFIYSWLFGAGDQKIGSVVGGSSRQGKELKERFLSKVPAIRKLKSAVDAAAKKGWMKALDGRRLHVRSQHVGLNLLCQSSGSILCKTWLTSFYDYMLNNGFTHGYEGDFVIVGWIHDEIQVACKSEYAEAIGDALVYCAKTAGEPYDFTVPLDSSYSIGNNWSETH